MKAAGWVALAMGCGTPLPSLEGRAVVEEISAESFEDREDLVLEVTDEVVYRFTTALGPIDGEQVVISALGEDHSLSSWLADAGLTSDDLDGLRIGTEQGLAAVDELLRNRAECCMCEQTPPGSDVMSCSCEFCVG